MKRIFLMVLFTSFVLFLASCSSRTSLTAYEFTSCMTNAGHVVEDVTAEFSTDGVVSFHVADCNTFNVEFIVYETESQAIQVFNNFRQMFRDSRGNTSSYREANLANYNRYLQISAGQFSFVSRIDNSVVIMVINADNRDAADAVIELLGY